MANKGSLFDRLKKAANDARSRYYRRDEFARNSISDIKDKNNGEIPEALEESVIFPALRSSDEAYKSMRSIEEALGKEQLKKDMQEATGDGRRFIDEVVNFNGPRWKFDTKYTKPQKVTQRRIRDWGEDGGYNLNEIPESIQSEFLDKNSYYRGTRPEEVMYSSGVYGVNGKGFRNALGDKFYVPNRSSEVFRR